jgi:hypothetical protein
LKNTANEYRTWENFFEFFLKKKVAEKIGIKAKAIEIHSA